MAVISLTTDFGDQDEYVGVMKGVMLAAAPGCCIVDLCHRIAPQNVAQAAFMIEAAFRHFPSRALHVLVVDPGVGGRRRILYAEAGEHRFLCPDNGLLTRVDQTTGLKQIRDVTNRTLFSPSVSHTFHGRDIMAPVAAYLIRGGDPVELGSEINAAEIVRLQGWEPWYDADGRLHGRIVSADRFGNLITNIDADLLAAMLADNTKLAFQIGSGAELTTQLCDAYEKASPETPLAIIGSRQTLEIAVNRGCARDHFKVAAGSTVTVRCTGAVGGAR
jgi:S-adenosylmethionine hydrolase